MATVDLFVQDEVAVGLVVFIICLSVPLSLVIVIGNAIVIVSIYRKSASVKSSSNIFIVSLALFDFLTGLIGIPFSIVGFLLRKRFTYSVNCAIWYFVPNIVFITSSVFNLLMISLDRFLAIKYPIQYHVWMWPGRAIRICIFVDILGILWGGISFAVTGIAAAVNPPLNVTYSYNCGQSPLYEIYGQPINDYINRPIISLTIVFLFILYAYIFSIASRKAKEAARRRGETVSTREMKITKTSAIVLLGYTLCIAPNVLKGTVQGYIDDGATWLVWYPWFTDFMLLSNSMINPFIYAGRSKLMRQDFSETIYFIFGKMCPKKTKERKALRPQSSTADIGSMSFTNISKSFSNNLND